MMRTEQMKSGNLRDKDAGFASCYERARQRTKQLQNLARLYTIGIIGLRQYTDSLSCFVGDFTKKKKKNVTNTISSPSDLNIIPGDDVEIM